MHDFGHEVSCLLRCNAMPLLPLRLPQQIPQRSSPNLHLPGHDAPHPRLGPGRVLAVQLGAAAGGVGEVGGGVGAGEVRGLIGHSPQVPTQLMPYTNGYPQKRNELAKSVTRFTDNPLSRCSWPAGRAVAVSS